MLLKNRKAIVTGGNQGIGKGIAIALAKAGADVVNPISFCKREGSCNSSGN